MDKTTNRFFGPEYFLKVSYIDVPRKGRLYAAIRKAGNSIIWLGAFIRAFGYKKQEIYPLKSLWEAVRDYKQR